MVDGLNTLQDGSTLTSVVSQDTGRALYWAADQDPKIVMQMIFDRQKSREREFERSTLFNRMLRSLKYYYGFFDDAEDFGDTAITLTGEQGQLLNFTLNYYRYLIRQVLTLITNEPLNYNVAAANTGARARIQSRLGKKVLEFYRNHRDLNDRLRDQLEDALVYGIGFLKVTWDPSLGEVIDADVDTNVFTHEGDVAVEKVDFTDLLFDFEGHECWEKVQWIDVRTRVNKYDLMARFPEFQTEIEAFSLERDSRLDPHTADEAALSDTDDIIVHEFFHKPTDALPRGRYLLYFEETDLLDIDNPYGCIPVVPLKLGVVRKSQLGWTPAFDIQKQQELLNEILVKLATELDTLGLPLLWAKTGIKQSEPSMFTGNIAFVESDEPPQRINLLDLPQDANALMLQIKQDMDTAMGINNIVQGGTAGSVRANRMQMFQQSQSLRLNSPVEFAYTAAFEEVGTQILEILKTFPETERTRTLVGDSDIGDLIQFTSEDLFDVTNVIVERANPILKTVEGRLEVLQILQQNGIPLPRNELVAILEGAPITAMTETIERQTEMAARENDTLLAGGTHLPLITDDHIHHIKKHASLLDTAEARLDPELSRRVMAALLGHLQLYNDPNTFEYQLALGYARPDVPPLGMRGVAAEAGQAAATQGAQNPAAQTPRDTVDQANQAELQPQGAAPGAI